ncbi:hypothetical protein GCM10011414_07320 [Croceivirga lutea]|uniref:hypothetical protein n=1 Tax=Croceivirga lutea TaxID=1775167 RepID=UPI00163B38E4|nr:hypothetical protein [Croceivirga lutea]GGG40349.1 hypothetical protein GCM10011414_07320 [Croceivirga lutea]
MIKLRVSRILLCVVFLTFIACDNESEVDDTTDDQVSMQDDDTTGEDNDDDTTGDDDNSDDDTTDDTTSIALEQISSEITIVDGTAVQGLPPQPNGSLDFQIATEDQSAYLGTGFLITVSSDDTPTGAYILFKDANGNAAESYFDVNFAAEKSAKRLGLRGKHATTSQTAKMVDNQFIEVAFTQNMPTGNFCYDICLYDNANNISQIVTRCVTVDEWGGDTNITGNWLFDRELENGIVLSNDAGETTVACNAGGSITVLEEMIEKDDWFLSLQPGGDYYEEYDFLSYDLDVDKTAADCEAAYLTTEIAYKDRYIGKWSYNASGLTIVDFAYEDLNDSANNETFESGELYFYEVDAEIIDGELVLSETVSFEGEAVTYQAIFKPVE